jgi:MFS family permease
VREKAQHIEQNEALRFGDGLSLQASTGKQTDCMKQAWPFLFYLSFFAAASALFPFTALYYQSIGLSGAQIGLLTGLAPLITMVGAPLWSGIADATHRHRLVLSFTILAAIASALVIPSIRNFVFLLPVIATYTFLTAPIGSLGDSATMSMLGDQREMYGRVRLGGSIGWGGMAYFAGRILDRNGIVWAFWIYAAGMVLNLLISQGLRFSKVEGQASFWNRMGTLLADRRWGFFLGMIFLCGMGMASINIYQFVYLAEIGASKSLMGLTLTISTLSELPVMFFSGWLLKRFKAQGLLTLCMAVIGVRLLLYSVFNFPHAILAIQVMHGLTFPAVWIAGVTYVHENAPGELSATGQGLFGAMMMGLGAAAGGFLGGWLIEAAGSRAMYLVFGAVVLAGAVFFTFFRRLMPAVPAKVG